MEVETRAIFDLSSSSSDQFEILAEDADTEQSDAPTDPELGRADYWTCIKCKNRKNNPLYRFCEKCFQVNYCFYFVQTTSYLFTRQLTSAYKIIHSNTMRHVAFVHINNNYYFRAHSI